MCIALKRETKVPEVGTHFGYRGLCQTVGRQCPKLGPGRQRRCAYDKAVDIAAQLVEALPLQVDWAEPCALCLYTAPINANALTVRARRQSCHRHSAAALQAGCTSDPHIHGRACLLTPLSATLPC